MPRTVQCLRTGITYEEPITADLVYNTPDSLSSPATLGSNGGGSDLKGVATVGRDVCLASQMDAASADAMPQETKDAKKAVIKEYWEETCKQVKKKKGKGKGKNKGKFNGQPKFNGEGKGKFKVKGKGKAKTTTATPTF